MCFLYTLLIFRLHPRSLLRHSLRSTRCPFFGICSSLRGWEDIQAIENDVHLVTDAWVDVSTAHP